jgi:acyl-homoserine-lactone acylase
VAALTGATPEPTAEEEEASPESTDDVGSNAWALAPSRTKSGRAILLRNPHLAWTAGYYEAHLTVPGVIDFYGDFRIGGPLIVIGSPTGMSGFDHRFNSDRRRCPRSAESGLARSVLLVGTRCRLRQSITVEFVENGNPGHETRGFCPRPSGRWCIAAHGYVALRGELANIAPVSSFFLDGREVSGGWRMRAHPCAGDVEPPADRAGNIFYLWNTACRICRARKAAISNTSSRDARSVDALHSVQSLPQFLVARRVSAERNDSPHFANVGGIKLRTRSEREPPQLHSAAHTRSACSTRNKFSPSRTS